MSRLALWNLLIGFVVIFISACAGAFIAWDMTEAFVHQPEDLGGWFLTLARSAHGHFNLFGYLHILIGLTLPYSDLKPKMKLIQTVGIFLGTLAMGPGMLWRAFGAATVDFDFSALVVGMMLAAALCAIALHILGIGLKIAKRS